MILAPGDVVERYRVARVVGQGGMATVYEAVHTRLGTSHALKVLRQASPALEARLLAEGRVQAQLRHPHVVPVTDVIDVGPTLGLVMDLVRGVSLGTLLAHEVLSLESIDALALDMMSGVSAAHEAGVVHRDLKPGNVLIEVVGDSVVAKVVDFGLVHVLDDGRPDIAGTPAYMAPEQIMGARVDTRADVFAMGAVLYELVCGHAAFPGDSLEEVVHRVKRGHVAPMETERIVPARMVGAIREALHRDPAARPRDATELRRRWLDSAAARRGHWPEAQLERMRALLDTQSETLDSTLTLSPLPTSPAR